MNDVGVPGGHAGDPQAGWANLGGPEIPEADVGSGSGGAGRAHAGADSRSPADPSGARRRHYAAFYGLEPLPAGRFGVVHGNCQAESLRLAIDGPDLATVRMPPVHELSATDLPHLERILARVGVLISQPVHPGYRDLPLGTQELTALVPPGTQVVRVPVIRFAGLYPAQAIIRPPTDRSLVPPLVPYHDLRILARASGSGRQPKLTPAKVRAVAAESIAELRRREVAHDTVKVSDLFGTPGFGQMRTINHPGNVIWETLARRLRDELGLGDGDALTRPLLDGLHAPREPEVIDAFALPEAPQPWWSSAGELIDPAEVTRAHLAWYHEHPDAVSEGLRRHAGVLQILAEP